MQQQPIPNKLPTNECLKMRVEIVHQFLSDKENSLDPNKQMLDLEVEREDGAFIQKILLQQNEQENKKETSA